MREGRSRSHEHALDGMGRFGMAGPIAALLALGIMGCPGDIQHPPKPDPSTTKVVVIKPDHSIADDQKSLLVSEKNVDVLQWHNTSKDKLLLVFQQTDGATMFPLTVMVEGENYSAPHPVNSICSCPKKKTTYLILHQDPKNREWVVDPSRPPTGPEVIVDD